MTVHRVTMWVFKCDHRSGGDGTEKGLLAAPKCDIELRLMGSASTAWHIAVDCGWTKRTHSYILCPAHSEGAPEATDLFEVFIKEKVIR